MAGKATALAAAEERAAGAGRALRRTIRGATWTIQLRARRDVESTWAVELHARRAAEGRCAALHEELTLDEPFSLESTTVLSLFHRFLRER